ncbi:hypothetical protein [Nocardia sp. NPDC050406]|uniref:hypothetical protein n=1 Tax=Nocardia sp. NPDC050406 TaxID=3364318 RepID=UPI0037ACF20A
MTRDLPFDDESGAGEGADTAYRVATGVSRVARAGAYVTGGALIAANGTPGESDKVMHDSRNVGWAEVNDPEPDAPSPVITFPELDPLSVPPVLGGPEISPVANQYGTDAGLFPTDFTATGAQGYNPSNPSTGWDPSAGLQHPGGFDPSAGLSEPGYNPATPTYDPSAGVNTPPAPAYDPSTGIGHGYNPGAGMGQPFDPSAGLAQPGGFDPSAGLGHPGLFDPAAGLPHPGGFDPSFGLVKPAADSARGSERVGIDEPQQDSSLGFGQFLKLPGADGVHLPGMPGPAFGLPSDATTGNPSDSGIFDGIGDNFGVFVSTDTAFAMHVGLDGVWIDSHMKVDIAVGDVGDQLDNFNQSVENALSNPANIQGSGADQTAGMFGLRGPGNGSAANSPAAAGTSAPTGTTAPAGTAPAVAPAAPIAPAPIAPAAFAPAPVAPAAVAPAPVAPAAVVPVPVAPAPVAPVAVAQPVIATPLQTTIQPDAATSPIANVWTAAHGPSPLTAPAVAAPALFDTKPVTETTGAQEPSVTAIAKPQPLTSTPGAHTTAPHVSAPAHPDASTTLAPPTKIPGSSTDAATTKLPGVTDTTKIPATGDRPTTTGPDSDATTKTPSTAVTTPDTDIPSTHDQPATTRPAPSTVDDDHGVTPTIPDDIDTGTTPLPTVSKPAPTVTLPDNDTPDVTVPTVAPTQPHTNTPIEPDIPTITQAPIKPSLAPNPKPIADTRDTGGDAHPAFYTGDSAHLYDSTHDSGLLAYDGGSLSTHLVSEATFAETHHPVHGPSDLTLL